MRSRVLAKCSIVASAALFASAALGQSPELVMDILPGPWGSDPAGSTVLEDAVVFAAYDRQPLNGGSLWRTDGTAAGTFSLGVSSTGLGHGRHALATNGEVVLFWVISAATGSQELWCTDGTLVGTLKLGEDIADPEVVWVGPLGLFFYFANLEEGMVELWASDGSSGGTRRVVPLEGSLGLIEPKMATWEGRLAFWICNGDSGCSLWRSDGTDGGTRSLISGFERPNYSGPLRELAAGPYAYFHATRGGDAGLWRTDGTESGTVLVEELAVDEWLPFSMLADEDRLFFFRRTAQHDELRVARVGKGTQGLAVLPVRENYLPDVVRVGPSVLFWASDFEDAALQVTDGSPSGTGPFLGCPAPCNVRHLWGGAPAFFAVANGRGGYDPWETDGTPAGTHHLGPICKEGCETAAPTGGGIRWGSGWVFAATDVGTNVDLWWSAGPGTDIVRLTDFVGSLAGGFGMTVMDDQLVYSAITPAEGTELWRLDISGLRAIFADGFETGGIGGWTGSS